MPKTKAQRMKAHRARKREGVTCLAHVPVYEADVAALVSRGLLRPEDTDDVARISEAVEGLVDDFTEGHGAGDASAVLAAPAAKEQPTPAPGEAQVQTEPSLPGSPGGAALTDLSVG